jgi:uncharacterized protein involved in exopolysaccharide biosynthesis
MNAYRATFDRHRALLCAPVVVAASLALWFGLGTPKAYEATATLWVDNPAPAPSSLTETDPAVRTPAEQQQLLIGELLQTRSFPLAVARRSPLERYLASGAAPRGWTPIALLSGLSGSPPLDAQILAALGPKRFVATVVGPQVLGLRLRAPTPTVAAGTLKAVIKELTARRVAIDVQRGQRTQDFYQEQVDAARKAFTQARASVLAYANANPAAGADDPNLKAALRAEHVASTDLARATTDLNQAKSDSQGTGASDTGIDVMDQPSAPASPTSGHKKLVETLIGGLFAGGLISLLGLVALTPSRPADPLVAFGTVRSLPAGLDAAGIGAGARNGSGNGSGPRHNRGRRSKGRGGRA